MKSILSTLLILSFIFTLTGCCPCCNCGKKSESQEKSQEKSE